MCNLLFKAINYPRQCATSFAANNGMLQDGELSIWPLTIFFVQLCFILSLIAALFYPQADKQMIAQWNPLIASLACLAFCAVMHVLMRFECKVYRLAGGDRVNDKPPTGKELFVQGLKCLVYVFILYVTPGLMLLGLNQLAPVYFAISDFDNASPIFAAILRGMMIVFADLLMSKLTGIYLVLPFASANKAKRGCSS